MNNSHLEGWLCVLFALAAVGFAMKQTVDKVKNGITSVGNAVRRVSENPVASHAAKGLFAVILHRMFR